MTSKDSEEWRPVATASEYLVSSMGRVRGKTWRILDPKPNPNGYVPVALCDKGRRTMKLAHVLVAQAFVPNPENKPIVNHINGVRHDNRAANLEWATVLENRHKRTRVSTAVRTRKVIQTSYDDNDAVVWNSIAEASRALNITPSSIISCCRGKGRTAGGCLWEYHDDCSRPPEEEWRPVSAKGRLYRVSSLGRVETDTGFVTYGSRCGNYLSVNGFLAHRLIAEAFLTKTAEETVVNHRDGNPKNNRADNLEWTTQRRNVAHSVALGLRKPGNAKTGRPVVQTRGGEYVAVYPSLSEASRATSVSLGHIWGVCQGRRRTAGGCEWTYSGQTPEKPDANSSEDLTYREVPPDDDPFWVELGYEPHSAEAPII